MARILVADDEADVRRAVSRSLELLGHDVAVAADGVEAIHALGGGGTFDLVITDITMPRATGFDVLRWAQQPPARTPVIVLTASTRISDCVTAMRAGALNFLVKPFHLEELRSALDGAIAQTLQRATPTGVSRTTPRQPQAELVGRSPALRDVVETVSQVAGTDATVLLTGESGTGKEVVARLIHAFSPRLGSPFVAVNCSAIPEGLVESELFGHIKGAFTGAIDSHPGRFVEADGGTVLLDEIGELPLGLQAKLLRVLQDRTVTPVGDSKARTVDIRIIAATNRDLEQLVQAGGFRRDLFFRLNVVPIRMPPLRERPEDIPALCRHFLAHAQQRTGKTVCFSDAAMVVLQLHGWPGNVRELENLVERLVILSRSGVIEVDDLPANVRTPAADFGGNPVVSGGRGINLPGTLARIESTLIERALRAADGNKSRAAAALGLNRTTLLDKLRRSGVSNEG